MALGVFRVFQKRKELCFAHNPEHASSTSWAFAFHCLSTVFHGSFFGVFHVSFCFAFYTICFHV